MTDWVEAIAERADVHPDEIRRVHGTYGIEASPTLPTPGRLVVKRIEFSGSKTVGGASSDFAFDWDLGPGLWGIVTDDANLRGKSTIIEVIRWTLRGRSSVQADVRAWLRSLSVHLDVNQRGFVIDVECEASTLSGRITTASGQELADFDSDETFEATMQGFMLMQLGLQPLAFFQKDPGEETGSRQSQGWAALSEALHIHSTDALLGDVVMAGLAGRLLQVYLGLPWTTTLAAISAAIKEVEAAGKTARRRDATPASQSQVRIIRAEITAQEERLAALPDPAAHLQRRSDAIAALAEADSEANSAAVVLGAAQHDVDQLRVTVLEDEQRLLDVQETGALRRFFNGVNPKVCPRCDEPVTRARRNREAQDGTCAVCSGSIATEAAAEADLTKLASDVVELRSALSNAEAAMAEAQAAHAAAEERRAAAAQAAADAAVVPDETQRRELELNIAGLRGQLQALEQAVLQPATTDEDEMVLKVLKSSEAEANQRAEQSNAELLGLLNEAVVELGHAFGFPNLEHVSLGRNGTLKLTKGGSQTSFSKLTGGEQLRIKIALVVALLRIGRDRGVGRHPGLILIDAPAGQETNDHDVRSILGALRFLTDELPEMQAIVATARGGIARELLPADRLRTPNADGYLW